MRKLIALTFAAALAAVPAAASAQEMGGGGQAVGGGGGGSSRSNNAFGLGVQSMLRGPGGLAATYDVGLVHVDGIFFFVDTDGGVFGGGDAFGAAVRAFYSLHQSNASDFGLGGGLGITIEDEGADDDTLLSLEFGAKVRIFVVNNVALTAFLGLGVVVDTEDDAGNDDEDAFVLGGQQVGAFGGVGVLSGFGFTYYFN
jgi:hypothetical protein